MDLNDDKIEYILDFDIPSGSEASFCDSDDQNIDDIYNCIPVLIDDLLGNVHSKSKFDDHNVSVDGVIVMDTNDVDNYDNFVKNI